MHAVQTATVLFAEHATQFVGHARHAPLLPSTYPLVHVVQVVEFEHVKQPAPHCEQVPDESPLLISN